MVWQQIARRGVQSPVVLRAMMRVPRHLFVPPEFRSQAYADNPLPIGSGQTISQPYIVAWMTELLELRQYDRVLEIGVGSGYQTAILAQVAGQVIGLERIPVLADQARARLASLGLGSVEVIVADGSEGYLEKAPYNGILAAAATPHIPRPLLEQLAEGGRLVLPVGDLFEQTLERVTRRGDSFHIERLGGVRFVPLIGTHGFMG